MSTLLKRIVKTKNSLSQTIELSKKMTIDDLPVIRAGPDAHGLAGCPVGLHHARLAGRGGGNNFGGSWATSYKNRFC
jgi:hypothetical protein